MFTVIDALERRGLVEAVTSEELRRRTQFPLKVYCGFDPTADGLHLGNMVPIMGLAWFQRFGHTPVIIVGGATGMVGDPSGKSRERPLLDEQTITQNLEGIRRDLESILDFNHPTCQPILLNNYDWFKDFSFIHFLRDVGKHFRMGPMLAKESVKTRLNSEEGMSYTEFSYQLLQGYDFLHLFEHYGVSVQIGGSDQWGNITAGKELIRRKTGSSADGLTFPLLTTTDGKKFGKSEQGAVWLSPEKCSPYDFYQYLLQVSDADVIRLMRMLTFMEAAEIDQYASALASANYVPNTAQKKLAEEITRIVHKEEGLAAAKQITAAAAPGAKTSLDIDTLERLSNEIPCYRIAENQAIGIKLPDLIVLMKLSESKSEVRRLIRNGGVYLNNEQIKDEEYVIRLTDFVAQRFLLVAIGKKRKMVLQKC